jgi:metal-dependent amidase/aminoacylase/carboxypeptidase family protein
MVAGPRLEPVADLSRHAVLNAVPAIFERCVGELTRVAGFIWRLPRNNGDSAALHHPAYNFNDDAIIYGTSYWIMLVETILAA